MAIIKLNYTRFKSRAKAALRYIMHRPGRENERITRALFSDEGKVAEKADFYSLIDTAAKGSRFFRMVLSHDPAREDLLRDLPLKAILLKTMRELQSRLGRLFDFVAVVHDDHTAIRHIHALIIFRGKIPLKDLQAIRKFATRAASLERRARDQARPLVSPVWHVSRKQRVRREDVFKTMPTVPLRTILCVNCFFAMERWRTVCQNCGEERHLAYQVSKYQQQRMRGRGGDLSLSL